MRQQGKGKGEGKGEDEGKCKDEKSNITEVDFLKTGQAKDNAHMAIRAHLQNLDDDGYFKILNENSTNNRSYRSGWSLPL